MAESPYSISRIPRVLDFRVPLPYLISAVAGLAFTLISMYFTLNQLVRDVGDLQITVKAGNNQSITMAGEQALLRFRLENAEGTLRDIRAMMEQRKKP